MKNENRDGLLKTLFTVIGALVSICAVIALAYVLFKKYFQVTFECPDGEGDGGIDNEDDSFAEDENLSFEPICCCDEEEPAEEEESLPAEEPEKTEE